VTGHLIERLPPGAPEMADFDAKVVELDARRSLSRSYGRETVRRYMRGYNRYKEWCRETDQQVGPEQVTSEKIRLFTDYMCTVKRYAPQTIWKNVRGVAWLAERAGAEVTTSLALGVLSEYRATLKLLEEDERARAAALSGGGG
jgi:hypothetical protein